MTKKKPATKSKAAPKKRDNFARRKQEAELLVKLCQVHHYTLLPKPKINMVMNFKTREVTPHLEYRLIVPADTALGTLIPYTGKKRNEFIEKAREDANG